MTQLLCSSRSILLKVTVDVAPPLRASVLTSDSECDLKIELKIEFGGPLPRVKAIVAALRTRVLGLREHGLN